MSWTGKRQNLVLGGFICIAGAAAAQGTGTRGVQSAYVAHEKAGLVYRVLLARNGTRTPVPTSFPFSNGDHVSLQLEVNQRSYVYVLNRTLQGDPEAMASRSLRLDVENDTRTQGASNPYTLLFPEPGSQYTVEPGRLQDVPPRGRTLTMVNPAGVEKLLVIVSPHPLDISAMFDPQTGQLARRGGAGAGSHTDSDADVLGKLNARLLAMEDNVDQARGIEIVPGTAPKPPAPVQLPPPVQPPPPPTQQTTGNGKPVQPVSQKHTSNVGVARQSDKPILVEIALKHDGS